MKELLVFFTFIMIFSCSPNEINNQDLLYGRWQDEAPNTIYKMVDGEAVKSEAPNVIFQFNDDDTYLVENIHSNWLRSGSWTFDETEQKITLVSNPVEGADPNDPDIDVNHQTNSWKIISIDNQFLEVDYTFTQDTDALQGVELDSFNLLFVNENGQFEMTERKKYERIE